MQISRLVLTHFRGFLDVSWEPHPKLNLITGANGAGKTTLLEALHLLAYGHSFRSRYRQDLVRQTASEFDIFVEWRSCRAEARITHRAGFRQSTRDWQARLDGVNVTQIGELCRAFTVVTFEPGSHALIGGGAELRRRFLDWGLFHVEQDFVVLWRRYMRALRQRNVLLKQPVQAEMLTVWDQKIAQAGELLTEKRQRHLHCLQHRIESVAERIAPSLHIQQTQFNPGWRRNECSLQEALFRARGRDQQLGHTTVGPHRADWTPLFGDIPSRAALSRGQAKLTALIWLLAQAEEVKQHCGEWPIIAMDDLVSELDTSHQHRVLSYLAEQSAQILVTATEKPAHAHLCRLFDAMFHVEHGKVVAQPMANQP